MTPRASVLAIVPAAGSGSRLGASRPKPLVMIEGEPILIRTLRSLKKAFGFDRIVMPVDPSFAPEVQKVLRRFRISGIELCAGGNTRAESVRNGLALRQKETLALVHDVARPFVSTLDVRRVIAVAAEKGGAILALQATSTIKEADPLRLRIETTRDRRRTWLAQTPQVFRADWLLGAYQKLGKRASTCTDEASLIEASGRSVMIVPGNALNMKITTPEDLKLARAIVRAKLV